MHGDGWTVGWTVAPCKIVVVRENLSDNPVK
jgi:hypothetical protein